MAAGRERQPVTVCPYPRGDLRRSAWVRGYAKARTTIRRSHSALGCVAMSEDPDGGSGRPSSSLSHASDDSARAHPPKWAWWVVGIAIPLLGILVTLLSSGSETPSSSAAKPSPGSTAKAETTAAPSADGQSNGRPPVRSGPVELSIAGTTGGGYIDLDAIPPLAAISAEPKGTDVHISMTTGAPDISMDGGAQTLAALPATEPEPSEKACAERIKQNGTYLSQMSRGARFCVQTTEGRTAYIKVVAAPEGGGTVRLKAKVWELPE
ncbi:Rmf/CrpP fold protein [Streptomyces sp. NPDC018019]|uniref:Rmf/CrpP fold protein n=1 Tax=Streptomyces sp. NPDC018019 TaxID=3365030 RepID=UPI003794E613